MLEHIFHHLDKLTVTFDSNDGMEGCGVEQGSMGEKKESVGKDGSDVLEEDFKEE